MGFTIEKDKNYLLWCGIQFVALSKDGENWKLGMWARAVAEEHRPNIPQLIKLNEIFALAEKVDFSD